MQNHTTNRRQKLSLHLKSLIILNDYQNINPVIPNSVHRSSDLKIVGGGFLVLAHLQAVLVWFNGLEGFL